MTKTTIRPIDIDIANHVSSISKELTTYRVKRVGAVPVLAKIYDQHIKILETQLKRLAT